MVKVKEGNAPKLLIDGPKEEFPKHKYAINIYNNCYHNGHRMVILREVELWIENIEINSSKTYSQKFMRLIMGDLSINTFLMI